MDPKNAAGSSSSDLQVCPEGEWEELCAESFETPEPSSGDTCATATLSCQLDQDAILRGDYEMDCCRDLPELTLGLIKPDGMQYLHEIDKRIRNDGFNIVQSRRVQLSPEQASNFYYEHYGSAYFPVLISSMIEGPIQVYVLRRKSAVMRWKFMCGPTSVNEAKKAWPDSLRGIYGTPGNDAKNVCHASATESKAREEIRFFFPSMILDDNYLNNYDVDEYIKEWVNPTLLEGLTQLCKNKPMDPIKWLGIWLLTHNPFKPKMAEKVAVVPT